MKNFYPILWIFLLIFLINTYECAGQCSVCTKTALQLGEKPARGLNQGIIYLMLTPLAVMGFIGYRWWKNEKS